METRCGPICTQRQHKLYKLTMNTCKQPRKATSFIGLRGGSFNTQQEPVHSEATSRVATMALLQHCRHIWSRKWVAACEGCATCMFPHRARAAAHSHHFSLGDPDVRRGVRSFLAIHWQLPSSQYSCSLPHIRVSATAAGCHM